MIGHLQGRIRHLQAGRALIEASGVGYEVLVPLSAHRVLDGQESAGLFVHTHVREDQITLFGFPSMAERDAFRVLIAVSGVGPRTALALLSSLSPEELTATIEGEQWRRLAAVPGIGKRTAERLVVELKGKLAATAPLPTVAVRDDAVSALVNLGYPARAAEETISSLLRESPETDLGELLRRALRALAR